MANGWDHLRTGFVIYKQDMQFLRMQALINSQTKRLDNYRTNVQPRRNHPQESRRQGNVSINAPGGPRRGQSLDKHQAAQHRYGAYNQRTNQCTYLRQHWSLPITQKSPQRGINEYGELIAHNLHLRLQRISSTSQAVDGPLKDLGWPMTRHV